MEKDENTINPKPLENCRDNPLKNKWNKCLDDYNNYSKEYIKHYKKSIDGNSASLSRYPYMKAKSEGLLQQLIEAQYKSLLTEKQIKKITKIQKRIANPCLD